PTRTQQRSIAEWIKIFELEDLPSTIKETYLGILKRVRRSQRQDVRHLFQIVAAAERPLTLQEVNIAFHICESPDGSEQGLQLHCEEDFREWIMDVCKGSLAVYDRRVYFIHQTAKDFLLANPGAGETGRP